MRGDFLLNFDRSGNGGALPTSLAGVRVTFNNTVDAALAYVSGDQIFFQVPWEMAGQSTASLTVTVNGQSSQPALVTLAPTAPALFSTSGEGFGQGAVLDANYKLVDLSHPAKPGTTKLRVYCTGLGATANQPADGAVAPANATVTAAVGATVGGVAATDVTAMLTPGLAGIDEVDFTVPPTAPTGGSVAVAVTAGGVASNTVTIALQSEPAISAVSPILAAQSQTITISGAGFGTHSAYDGNTNYLEIVNQTRGWSAGRGFDPVMLTVASWTDTQITLSGFSTGYGAYSLQAGDQLQVKVWNAQTGAGPSTYILPAGQWQLIWSDEFSGAAGAAPDARWWGYDTGAGGWGNNELETYTNSTDNARLDGNGNLDIHVLNPSAGSYTSARMKTQDRFNVLYGRIEARIKLPHGQGIWPAFWMLGQNITTINWPFCDEIDIMENIGKLPDVDYGTAHGAYVGQQAGNYSAWGRGGNVTATPSGTLSSDFHIYAVEWSPNALTFFLDGVPYVTVAPNGTAINPYPAAPLVALAANGWSVLLLRRHDARDINVRSAFLHLAQDALASLAVVVAALLSGTRFGIYLDPAAALVVGAVVLRGALLLVWETMGTLLEAAPVGVDLDQLVDQVNRLHAPARIHHVHLWEIAPGQRLLTAHVDLGQEMGAREIEALLGGIKALLRRDWEVNHATLEPEVEGCGNGEAVGPHC
jgi:uncharacterized protein (TIGR03437 family)